MTPWERINNELLARGKTWLWLGEDIPLKANQMGNWNKRGVPAKHHAAIAKRLGKTVDWINGIDTAASWPFTLVTQARYEALSSDAKGAVQSALRDAIEKEEREASKAYAAHKSMPEIGAKRTA